MQYPQDNRGTSDTGQPLYNRNFPGTKHYPTSQPSYMMNTADNVIQVQDVSQSCPDSLTAMPYCNHGACNRSQPHETCTQSHGRHYQYHPCVGAHCPYLPHLKTPFAATYSNQGNMDRISHLSHKPVSSFSQYQNLSSAHTIRQASAPIQYNMSSSFVPNGQSTLSSQQTNDVGIDVRDFQSHMSTTPRLSHDTTPDSIFSAPHRPAIARNGSREVGSPASTVSAGNRALVQTNTISPLQVPPGHDRDLDGQENTYDNWISAHNGDNPEWLNNYDQEGTLDQTLDQRAVHPEMLANNTFQPPHMSNRLVPNQAPPGSDTDTSNDWDPVFGLQAFSVPPSFDDLTGESHETENGSYPTFQQNAYIQQQPGISGYQQGFDLNAAPYGNSSYNSLYAPTAPTLPSLGFDTTLSVTNGAGSRGRQGNQDAQKDELLVRLRQEGKSYKEIMKMNIFNLEESTLRGRYRTLTKSKEQRLRKPAWDSQAVQALQEGVEALAPTSAKRPRTKEALDKIPWKKVAEWMRDNRGCYHYGNATVKKKYQELIQEQVQTSRSRGRSTY